MVCQSVLNNLMYNSLSNEFLEKMDERRRLMIENELTQLVSKRDQVHKICGFFFKKNKYI